MIKFISYDGEWPNLCSGVLTLLVDNQPFIFERHSLISGGCVSFGKNWSEEHIVHGKWSVKKWPKDFPDKAKQEALDVINQCVPLGCCGGCA